MQPFPSERGYRNLLYVMVMSQFKRRDQGTILGILWSVLNPLLMLTIIYVVFNYRMGSEIDNYAVYLLIGIVIYTHFANSTTAAMQVFHSMSALTANAVFPKEILVIATVIARSIEFGVSLLVCIAIAGLVGVELTVSFFWIFIVLLLQTAFALSVSLVLSCLYLYMRDIDHIYQVFLRLLFFLTPIFYNMDYLGDGPVRTIVMLNPLTHITNFARSAILGGESVFVGMTFALLATIIFLFAAFLVFKKFEPFLAERV